MLIRMAVVARTRILPSSSKYFCHVDLPIKYRSWSSLTTGRLGLQLVENISQKVTKAWRRRHLYCQRLRLSIRPSQQMLIRMAFVAPELESTVVALLDNNHLVLESAKWGLGTWLKPLTAHTPPFCVISLSMHDVWLRFWGFLADYSKALSNLSTLVLGGWSCAYYPHLRHHSITV